MAKKVSWHGQVLPPIDSSKSEIRTLQIEPGAHDSPLQCKFQVTSLDNPIPYEALSYAWGNDSAESHESIYFGESQVGVTPSLADALRRLRLSDEPRHVWADALCINQTDNVEKSLQVSMMGRIYTQCKQGAIWLGSLGDIDPADALAVLDMLSFIAGDQAEPGWMKNKQRRISVSAALKHVLNVSWWNRIWTVQEAFLPPKATVYWGPSCEFPWDVLHRASESFFNDKAPPLYQEFWSNGCIFDIQAALRGLSFSRNEEVFELLWRWRYRKATDPRDKVYGVLGFRQDISLPSVKMCNYDVDVRTLYHAVTIDLIGISTDLHPLIGRGGEGSDIPGLASWAVDWNGVQDDARRSKSNFWDHHHWWFWGHFTADRGMYGVGEGLRVEDDNTALRICGLKLSRVALVDEIPVGQDIPGEGSIASIFRALGDRWGKLLLQYHEQFPGILSNGGLTAFLGVITGNFTPDNSDDDEDKPHEWVEKMVRPQAIFITEDGKIGLGPPNIRPGQELWIIGGCRVPVILNPLPQSDQEMDVSLTFHSECFVYGIMRGEAVEGREDDVIEILLR